jgi:hypothetical protein
MKKTLIAAVTLMLGLMPALAQDPLEPPQGPPPEMWGPEMGPPPSPEPPQGEQPGTPFVDRWLDRMKEKNPEEYDKLQKLRETSPEQFRQALHDKLKQEKTRSRLHDGRHGPPPPLNPEIVKLEKETMEISRGYRETTDEAQKTQIRKDLRGKLEVLFELREKDRQELIRRIETDLARLKKSVDERRNHRDQIIERRLQELTDGDGLRW